MASNLTLDDVNLERDVHELSITEILDICHGHIRFSREQRQHKALAVYRAINAAPTHLKIALQVAGCEKRLRTERERVASHQRHRDRERARIERTAAQFNDVEEPWDTSKFLHLPTPDELKLCYSRFYDATSNHALRHSTCAVCARNRLVSEAGATRIQLDKIPNRVRLCPREPHAAHILSDGMLLERSAVQHNENNNKTYAVLCRECLESLRKENTDLPPKFSLANNLWIGEIPHELQNLTFPEQLLLAQLYPRVFVFKLFPKKVNGIRSTATLQSGLRGNVSTYALNSDAVADMITGNLMPRPPRILASVIAITFIGLGNLPHQCLRSLFRVRRQVLLRALVWLKNNNRHYSNIEINEQVMQQLPEDDVPEEILSILQHSEDVAAIDEETAGYVPNGDEEDDFDDDEQVDSPQEDDPGIVSSFCCETSLIHILTTIDRPDVFPIQISGSVDGDLCDVHPDELMRWGLANMCRNDDSEESAYAVRHSRLPVSDFGRPRHDNVSSTSDTTHNNRTNENLSTGNFFEKAFPLLYPYGVGGIEGQQQVSIGFMQHVRWSLEYHDRRFRKHETFPYVAFGIEQKRQALNSARVQIHSSNFDEHAPLLSSISVERLQQASTEEDEHGGISDPVVRLLRKQIHATAGRVVGTDQSRFGWRNQIWTTSMFVCPATLWITVNPCDLHDPIAQIFVGEDIDLDAFLNTMGPDKHKRATNIAGDPFAAAKFFHFIIKTMFECLFNIKVSVKNHHVDAKMGALGEVAAYFGTVESQKRGTLHLHLLLWLKHAPSSDEMRELLKNEEFRRRIIDYTRQNLKACAEGLETEEQVQSTPNEIEIGYSRPVDPNNPNYDAALLAFERRVARSKQVHTCEIRRCLRYDRSGKLRCKRRAPFPISYDDFIDEFGRWSPKRLYGFFNGWVRPILLNMRCNNDGKFLSNGADTLDLSYYVTNYAAKKQSQNYSVCAILAKGLAKHLARNDYWRTLQDQQRLLNFRLVYALTREQEISGPMIMSYLMGWGDCYRSHTYTNVYWASFVASLLRIFPQLLPHS